ncbi:fibronectin type III domain-containing protein [Paractinoplanes globisporus]|uniref:Fibronectin type III domain-containing protein n=1 Tax=Paractinoplanes globisporus TaxID=113565 RepID=A0ABW6W7H9_9ACTN|nr:fibronectin type III domain-containing protein [Actinoplanes globisporus]
MSSPMPSARRRRGSWLARAGVATISIFAAATGQAVFAEAAPPDAAVARIATALADPPPVPTGAVASVTVTPTPGSTTVEVTWEPLDPAGWNGSQIEAYEVHIIAPDDAHPTNGCDALIADTSCIFVTDKAGVYTATVAAHNETGTSADSTQDTATLVLDPPAGPVANLAAVSTYDQNNDRADVGVTWDALSPGAWNVGSQYYHVTIDPPDGMTANPAWCPGNFPEGDDSCHFTTTGAGLYTIRVAPANEAGEGTAAETTVDVELRPGAAVGNLTLAPRDGAGLVGVSWEPLPEDDWNGETHHYDVQIAPSGDGVLDDDCRRWADEDATSATGCSFKVDATDTYTVTVTAVNELGSSTHSTSRDISVTLGGPTGPVDDLTVHTQPGSGVVEVSWTPLAENAWNGALTRYYSVAATGPGGETVTDLGTCAQLLDGANSSCSFLAAAPGNYQVQIVAMSEGGVSTAAGANIQVVLAPTGTVGPVDITNTPGTGEVELSWDQMTDGWGGAQQRKYEVTITGGGTLTDNTCDSVPDGPEPSCSFTAGSPGPFTVVVKAADEVGAAPGGASADGLIELAPTATVSGLTAVADPDTSTVTVQWTKLDDGDWRGNASRAYRVSVDGPDGTVLSGDACTAADIPDSETPGCSFQATRGGHYTVTVVPVTESGVGIGGPATATADLVLAPAVPLATVTGLRVEPTTGTATIPVGWDAIPADDDAWGGALTTHNYIVTISGPDDATIDPGTCTTVSSASCQFSTDRGGDYTVQVALGNEAGTSPNTASDTGHLTLAAPSGQVGPVTVNIIDGSAVDLSWPSLADSDWNAGETRSYAVTIDGGLHLVENNCDSVPAPETSCSFAADTSGPFTVTVKAVNEAGTAATGASAGGTVVVAPSAGVSGLHTNTSMNSPTVTVGWDQLTTGWESGTEKTYAVSVEGPFDATLSNDSCTMEPVGDDASPSCTFDVSEGGDYVVYVQPQNEGGLGPVADETAHVTLKPIATVTGVTVTALPGSSTVNVGWDRLADNDWNGGATHHYVITLQAPPNAVLGDNTCTTVDDEADPHCGFTTDTPGAYAAQVLAVNEAGAADTPGTGTATLASGIPAAATLVTGASGVNAITASWTAAVTTSLAGVSSYTVSAVADGYPDRTCAGTVTASPCTITDVAAGVPYTVRVVANGPGGSSSPADSAEEVVPAGTPKAPVEVPSDAVPAGTGTAQPGAGITITGSGYAPFSTVVLSLFSVPVSLGTAIADANGAISVTVNLPPGTPTGGHTLLATGLDANGDVLNLAKSVAVTAATPAPTTSTLPIGVVTSLAIKQVAADTRDAVVTWAPGQVSWGTGVRRTFQVSVSGPAGARITGSCTETVDGAATSCGFTTDTNGIYAVRVTAGTEAGRSSQFATAGGTVTVAPGAPTKVTGVPGANSIRVSWQPPASAGAGVDGYQVTVTAPYYPVRGCDSATHSPCTITGLAAGVRYVARVVATGSGGNSPTASSASTIIPTGEVYVPSAVPSNAVDNGSRTARPGARVVINGAGYRPGTRVRMTLFPGGISLGATNASAKGTVSIGVTMPAKGSFTVLTTGLANGGRVRYLATALHLAGVTGGPLTAHLVTGTGTTSSSASDLAVTGAGTGPLLLAGFLMITTGLVLVTTRTRPRRTAPRHAHRSRG